MHLIGNMWFLWIYGDNVEDVLGHTKYLQFYLFCGVAAALVHVMLGLFASAYLGASGAIAGVTGAYMIKFPNSRIITLVPISCSSRLWRSPLCSCCSTGSLLQVFSGVGSIGYRTRPWGRGSFAHIGGFVACIG